MAEHEGGQWLLPMGKTALIKVGNNGDVLDIGVEVWFNQVGVHKGRREACWDAAQVDWVQGWDGS